MCYQLEIMTKIKAEVKSAQVAETSKSTKGATPAKSTASKAKAEVTKKEKVITKNKETVAEATKERVLLYHYPALVAEGKTEGERQRRKKQFRQEMRGKIKTLLKNYKALKGKGDEKAVKDARIALKNFVKENLTPAGQSKFKVGFLFEKKVKVS